MTTQSRWVAGVDGCGAGWFVVLRDTTGTADPIKKIVTEFADIPRLPQAPVIIAIDIPIGLPESIGRGGRSCDVAARAVVGKLKSSVFSIPARAAVMQLNSQDVKSTALAHSNPSKSVSPYCLAILPKVREAAAWIASNDAKHVHECHPEVSFWACNDRLPLDVPKKKNRLPFQPGTNLRRALLRKVGYTDIFFETFDYPSRMAGFDDMLDACIAAWTAERILNGIAISLPDEPQCDSRGIPIAIWA